MKMTNFLNSSTLLSVLSPKNYTIQLVTKSAKPGITMPSLAEIENELLKKNTVLKGGVKLISPPLLVVKEVSSRVLNLLRGPSLQHSLLLQVRLIFLKTSSLDF